MRHLNSTYLQLYARAEKKSTHNYGQLPEKLHKFPKDRGFCVSVEFELPKP